jgi:hypothetical protein
MGEFKEQAHVHDVPRDVLLHAIEAISEGLIQDAKYNFGREAGFGSKLLVKEDDGVVFCEVKFVPYDYRFKWLVEPEKAGGSTVTFIGQTPDRWWEWFTREEEKLKGIMETQWSAFLNFGIGYVTSNYYHKHKGKPLPARVHIRRAALRVKRRAKTEHKKTRIG